MWVLCVRNQYEAHCCYNSAMVVILNAAALTGHVALFHKWF